MHSPWVWVSILFLLDPQIGRSEAVSYDRDIKPLFAEKCGVCHGALAQEAGLRLDAGELIRKGGDQGRVIIPGRASESRLIRRVTSPDLDERMPPEGEGAALTATQVAFLTTWINEGATIPAGEVIPDAPQNHWAYQVPHRSPLPQVDDPRWSHPVDAFIARHHRDEGVTAVALADRHTLLRRVYFDLIGLPPTAEQIESFVNDDSATAWSLVVESLLDNPHYGERWGRHWMDVWRYSDWDGYKQQLRGSQRHIWRWRDWIVDSLNRDKGYDRMVLEMLAGDEIAPDDPHTLAATGFLARNYHTSNRNIWLDATVEHTAKAFLGLTLNCARCHDHKFDPISQTAYYQFRAIFEPHQVRTDRLPGQADLLEDGLARAFDANLSAETFLYVRGNDKVPDKDNPLAPAVPRVLGGSFVPRPVPLPIDSYYPALRQFVLDEERLAAQKQLDDALRKAKVNNDQMESRAADEEKTESERQQLQIRVARLAVASIEARQSADLAKFSTDADAQRTKQLATRAAAAERQLKAGQARLAVHVKQAQLLAAESGDEKDPSKQRAQIIRAKEQLAAAKKQQATAEAALEKTDADYTSLGVEHPRTSSGRRRALAEWIISAQNPVTARVAVNHIWMRHFGAPLVDNVFDFGLRSPRPMHYELLDWLAVELMENQWSLKHLHQLILSSRTWRLASAASSSPAMVHNRKVDRDNQRLWRMNVRRLDAEVIRDSVLAVAGQLDTRMGGADIDYRQGEESRRRSIYFRHAYEKQMKMLVLFDAASPNECYRRSESIIPQQALALTNSSLALTQSRLLARQLWKHAAGGPAAASRFIQSAFLSVLSRPPEAAEENACLEFLNDQERTLSAGAQLTTFNGGSQPKVPPDTDSRGRARENLVHVLLNHNDFVTVR